VGSADIPTYHCQLPAIASETNRARQHGSRRRLPDRIRDEQNKPTRKPPPPILRLPLLPSEHGRTNHRTSSARPPTAGKGERARARALPPCWLCVSPVAPTEAGSQGARERGQGEDVAGTAAEGVSASTNLRVCTTELCSSDLFPGTASCISFSRFN
jgi:hypothetical protein